MDVVEIKALSALLDAGMELGGAEREAWLRGLEATPGEPARLAPMLRRMLGRAPGVETADVLERGPRFEWAGEAEANAFTAGDLIGPYRLLRALGAGGMGEVWLAERADGQLTRQVALKLPLWQVRRAVLEQRFARERDILAALEHPNIARLYDAGVAGDGQPWLALEFVEGLPITEHCARHALPLRERVALLVQVARAVQHAHAHLVIHRDLKPANVLVRSDGVAMLLDFGIAKLLDDGQATTPDSDLTRQGGRALTPAYAAPEQIAGTAVSTVADVHALGVLLYELVCGRRPFEGSRAEVENAVLTRDPPRPRGLSADLVTVMFAALKKLPAERYASAEAFAEDLLRWQRGEAVRARGDSPAYRTWRFVTRHRWAVGTASVALLAIAAASGVALRQAALARTEARTAAAVQDFLEGVFRTNRGTQLDPVRARQRTARDLLDEGAARIDTELEAAPEAKLRVLATLAAMYRDMGEAEPAARLLDRSIELDARLYPQPRRERIQKLALAAATHLGAGNTATALRHLEAGRALLAALGHDDDGEIALALVELDLARYRGDASAIPLAERTIALLRSRGQTPELRDASASLAALHARAGRPEQALPLLRQAVAVEEQLGIDASGALTILLREQADVELELGHLAAGEASLRKAIAYDETTLGPDNAGPMRVWGRLGQVLAESGRAREALPIFERLRQRSRSRPGEDTQRDHDAAFDTHREAQAWWRWGHPAKALALLDDPGGARPGTSSGQFLPIDWQLLRARILATQGRFEAARAALAAAETLRAERQVRSARVAARLRRGAVEIELAEGRPGPAVAGWSPQPARQPAPSYWLADRAEITLLAGDPVAAAKQAADALAELAAREPDPTSAEARLRLHLVHGKALLRGRQASAASAALRLALAADEAIHDPAMSPQRAAALACLARALRDGGEGAAAAEHAARAQAIRRRHVALGPQFDCVAR